MNILVVDDEPTIRNGVKRTIEAVYPEAIVRTAESGETALPMLDEVDTVFLDMKMPGMGGLELLRLGGKKYESINWIVISAYSDFTYAQQALRYGAKDYLLKPVGRRKLMELLQELKEKKQLAVNKQASMTQRIEVLSEPPEMLLDKHNDNHREIVETAIRYIKAHYHENLSLGKVAATVYLNPVYFSHLLKQLIGIGYKEYVIQLRIEKARELLQTSDLKITDIAERVGYPDLRHFTQVFRKTVNMTPSEYRLKHNNTLML